MNDTSDIIDYYNKTFDLLENEIEYFENKNIYAQIQLYTSGLALSNSIHEMFITSLLKSLQLSNNKISRIIKAYKSPIAIDKFIELLHLDLTEPFNLNKHKVTLETITLNTYQDLIHFIKEQRIARNNYLHGSYDMNSRISKEDYYKNIIDYQKSHCMLMTLISYSFKADIPRIKESLPYEFEFISNINKVFCLQCKQSTRVNPC